MPIARPAENVQEATMLDIPLSHRVSLAGNTHRSGRHFAPWVANEPTLHKPTESLHLPIPT